MIRYYIMLSIIEYAYKFLISAALITFNHYVIGFTASKMFEKIEKSLFLQLSIKTFSINPVRIEALKQF